MRYGVTLMLTDVSIGVIELAQSAEERGFHSLWLPEHTHIPVSRRTPPPTGEEALGEEYKRLLDPLVALAAAATTTEHLRLGTGVLLPAQRDPIVTAKAVASLDHVSGGRVSLGVGFGWNEDEMNHHGVRYDQRRNVAREHVLAMQALWDEERAAFEGAHTGFSTSWSWPKPVQTDSAGRSAVPVMLGGGAGSRLFEHVAEYAAGWMPIGGSGLRESIPRLHKAVADAGRDPSTVEVMPFGVIPDRGKLEHLAEMEITECVFLLPSGQRDEVLPILDDYAALLPETA
jgi:probable F420-dependent oxidoreductase